MYYASGFLYLETGMQFTVTYNSGVWTFTVEATDPESDYFEEFEITDEAEAKTAAADLIEELAELFDEE